MKNLKVLIIIAALSFSKLSAQGAQIVNDPTANATLQSIFGIKQMDKIDQAAIGAIVQSALSVPYMISLQVSITRNLSEALAINLQVPSLFPQLADEVIIVNMKMADVMVTLVSSIALAFIAKTESTQRLIYIRNAISGLEVVRASAVALLEKVKKAKEAHDAKKEADEAKGTSSEIDIKDIIKKSVKS